MRQHSVPGKGTSCLTLGTLRSHPRTPWLCSHIAAMLGAVGRGRTILDDYH